MNKKVCDVCGTEITNAPPHNEVSSKNFGRFGVYSYSGVLYIEGWDLCWIHCEYVRNVLNKAKKDCFC